MPGAMHRMGVYLGLVEDEEFVEGAEGWDSHDSRDSQTAPRERNAERAPARRDGYGEPRYSRDGHPAEPRGRAVDTVAREYHDDHDDYGYADYQPAGYQITALHPRTYNEARTIGEAFRQNTPVIMNLSEMDDADAKRLVDFAAGLTFGLRGRIERVTAKVFLLSPHNVTVTAQDKARIENGFFNQS
jgi:cell division inhibitor SepF